MISTVKQAKELAKEYNGIESDLERLGFLAKHPGEFKVVLDNDCTSVEFNIVCVDDDVQEEAIAEIRLNDFDEYHGWTDGVLDSKLI